MIESEEIIEDISGLFGDDFKVDKAWSEHDRYNYFIVSKDGEESWWIECGYGRRQVRSAHGLGVDGYFCKLRIHGIEKEIFGEDAESFSTAVEECHNKSIEHLEEIKKVINGILEEIS